MIRVVRLCFKQEHIADFKSLFESRKENIRHFNGCRYLELWQDKQDARVFYTYSIWDEESHLEDYRVSELFQDTWGTVKQWFDAAPQAFSADPLNILP
ncbi:MAG: antibiotic biosynthesis monooxygenase [Chitinophagaceae bacterium]|nr:antibiotic biosynthesis monooxygenase [Chitinophagaceae bacterium]